LTGRYLLFLSYSPHGCRPQRKMAWENGHGSTHTADLGVAKRLPSIPVVLSANLEKTFHGDDKEFRVNFT